MTRERDDTLPVASDGTIDIATIASHLIDRVDYLEAEDLGSHGPTAGRVAKQTESGEFYIGDGSQWQNASEWLGASFGSIDADSATVTNGVSAGSVDAGSASITNDVSADSVTSARHSITGNIVYAHGSNGNFTESYPISDYADVLDACQQAHDDMPNTGGTVVIPPGTHQTSTQLHIWKTFGLKTVGGFSSRFGQDTEASQTRIVWNGGTTTPLLVQPTVDTPTGALAGVEIGALSFEPATDGGGDRAIHIASSDRAVRNVLFDKTLVRHWGGSNPAVHLDGNVFSVYADHFRAAANDCTAFGVLSPTEPASEIYFQSPEVFSTGGNWALRLETNTWGIFGGAFQHVQSGTLEGGHGVDVHGAGNGGIWGTQMEGHENGGIGIRLSGPSDWSVIRPVQLAKFDTGIQLGNSSTNQNTTNVTIDTHFNKSVLEDVKVLGGGQRENLRILCPTPGGITDERNLTGTDVVMYNGDGQGGIATSNVSQRPSPGSRAPGTGTLFSTQFDGQSSASKDEYLGWEDGSHWYSLSPLWGSYTGDGTAGQTVDLNIRPTMAIITDGSSSVMAIRSGANALTIPMHGQTSIGGTISFTNTGFTVDAGGADAFPNTTSTSYDYYIQ